jgi:signal peptidase I
MAGLHRLRGPWRVAVVEGSMRPAIEGGDWLLVDPTTLRWPRRGSVVVFREPDGETLAIKRVAAGPGERVRFADGYLVLADDEAWLLSDASPEAAAAAGDGPPIDSRRYGPVPVALLVGRAWFRYAPLRRIGRIPGPPPAASALEAGLEPFPGRPGDSP